MPKEPIYNEHGERVGERIFIDDAAGDDAIPARKAAQFLAGERDGSRPALAKAAELTVPPEMRQRFEMRVNREVAGHHLGRDAADRILGRDEDDEPRNGAEPDDLGSQIIAASAAAPADLVPPAELADLAAPPEHRES